MRIFILAIQFVINLQCVTNRDNYFVMGGLIVAEVQCCIALS
eukprot:SAG31_NODE_1774_length_7303_cov_4.685453_7_plen_42_part_00